MECQLLGIHFLICRYAIFQYTHCELLKAKFKITKKSCSSLFNEIVNLIYPSSFILIN